MSDIKKTKYFRILEITEWEVNRPLVRSNADHCGEDYNAGIVVANEVVKEMYTIGGLNLPFVCEAANEDEALAKYAEKYEYDLAIPVKAEIEEVHKYAVSKQVDCRVEVVVYGKDFDEAKKAAESEEFERCDLNVINTHCVNATDCETNEVHDF